MNRLRTGATASSPSLLRRAHPDRRRLLGGTKVAIEGWSEVPASRCRRARSSGDLEKRLAVSPRAAERRGGMFGLKKMWSDLEPPAAALLHPRDYEGGVARWCPGCGDHGGADRRCSASAATSSLPPERWWRSRASAVPVRFSALHAAPTASTACTAGRCRWPCGVKSAPAGPRRPGWRQATATAARSAPGTGCTPHATTWT